jgi:signal transduction histidine kinase
MQKSGRDNRFISLRWRLLLPVALVTTLAAMLGAFWLAGQMNEPLAAPQANLLMQSSNAVSTGAVERYEYLRAEAQRLAFTHGMVDLLRTGSPANLQRTIEPLAQLAGLDAVILTGAEGVERIGLLRVGEGAQADYAVSAATDLSGDPTVQSVLRAGAAGSTGLTRTSQGLMLLVGVPVFADDERIGIALVGQRLETVLQDLTASTGTQATFFGSSGTALQTTLPVPPPNLAAEVFSQRLNAAEVQVEAVTVAETAFQSALIPFRFGGVTLGVVGLYLPDTLPALAANSRLATALTLAAVAGTVVLVVFVVVDRQVAARAERVTAAAQALTRGQPIRTGMAATDEIGGMGRALDQLADATAERMDGLRVSLRRQRRENEYLLSALESLPEGVLVQDIEGRVLVMNERARDLLKSESLNVPGLTGQITDYLGVALAPGLYTLGDPQRVEVEGRMLSAQAAAITDLGGGRVGTVVLLRDITIEVRRERLRERVLNRMSADVQQPLAERARRESHSTVARELSRHAAALQKLILEMREITMADTPLIQQGQRPLHLETLVWNIANEWRQVARAANLSLSVEITQKGLFVLGDERRLRWAIGNLMDNALKYTSAGGQFTLEVQGEVRGQAALRIRDNGTGIRPEELPHVFTRFYRGTPTLADGTVIRTPGAGQGLSVSKQIIEAHGGAIEIKSKSGVGTAVYFTLPLTAPVTLALPVLADDLEGETVLLNLTANKDKAE